MGTNSQGIVIQPHACDYQELRRYFMDGSNVVVPCCRKFSHAEYCSFYPNELGFIKLVVIPLMFL